MPAASLIATLPLEIHLLIAALLLPSDRLHLKLTCTYFYATIPPLTHRDLLQAEQSAQAIAKDIYACRYCLRLRPARKFADRMLRRRRGRFGRDAGKRFCVECGLAPRSGEARYGPGAEIVICGVRYIICICCGKFREGKNDRERRGGDWCEGCWEERWRETTKID